MLTAHSEAISFKAYFPGVVGKITELHAVFYHDHWGLDLSFETQVGRELSDFLHDFREGRDLLKTVFVDTEFAGSIVIDARQADTQGVRLRWFMIEPGFQGHGLGSRLIREAVEFCREAGYRRIFLWTFQGLERARSLYEKTGFTLSEEHEVFQWGRSIREQRFDLLL